MASSSSSNYNYSLHFFIPSSLTIAILLLLLLLMIPTTTGLSQDPVASGTTLQSSCKLIQLTSLLPCTTFVQGTTPEPAESCCDNLGEIYREQPQCLCSSFLQHLNTSLFFDSFPINTTLLLKLPSVCNLQPDASACKKSSIVSSNATVAASPMNQVEPMPTNLGGFTHSESPKLDFFVGVATMTLLACFQLII